MPTRLSASLLTLSACLGLMACEAAPPAQSPQTSATAEATTPAVAPPVTNSSLSPEGQPLEQALACRDERGAEQAQVLANRCIAVSPATRPPCHIQNPCALIEGEIKRACDQYGPDETRPNACAA